MRTNILHGLPIKNVEAQEGQSLHKKAPLEKQLPGFGGAKSSSQTSERNLGLIGKEILKRERGEAFTLHYHAASEAAGALQGDGFLQQYRALKKIAREQGMPESEFRGYERCLYRRFYQAAAQDTVRAHQTGRKPKVEPGELAYIAKVADISEEQIRRDSLIFQKCEFVAQIKALQTRNRNHHA